MHFCASKILVNGSGESWTFKSTSARKNGPCKCFDTFIQTLVQGVKTIVLGRDIFWTNKVNIVLRRVVCEATSDIRGFTFIRNKTLFDAFRAKAYRGKIPRVTAILSVGRVFSRDSVYVDKTKSVMSDCGILEERKRNWGDEFAGKFGIVKRTMKSL